MIFGKAVAKGEGQIVSEYRELSDKEKLSQALEHNTRLRKRVGDLEEDSLRYRRMRQLEVVIMAEDGAKYLKGKELDEYIDSLPYARQGGPLRSAQFIKEATPLLNEVFAKEYAKYVDEHADAFAAHIDAEVMRNVHKT
jgi:hypothetical protein